MRSKSVAILDIRSGEVSFLLGAKGVNDTFVLGGNRTEKYAGYSVENGFHDEVSFFDATRNAITPVLNNHEGQVDEIFVGVPSCFISVLTKGHTKDYYSKRRISAQDVDALYESGQAELMAHGQCIRRSDMYLTLGDNRKYFSAGEVYGVSSTLLQGALCYYFVSDSFYEMINGMLKGMGFSTVHFIPSTLAQAMYLLPKKKREGYAFLLDFGHWTSSISVIYGNGIVHEEAYDCGYATVFEALKKQLEVSDAVAEEIIATADISGGSVAPEQEWVSELEKVELPIWKINEVIKYELNNLTKSVTAFFEKYYKDKSAMGLTVNPIGLTGEGVGRINGSTEYIENKLSRYTEVIYPDLPYYDKPAFSSRISLLDMALSDNKKRGWFYKIFNSIGGKKK